MIDVLFNQLGFIKTGDPLRENIIVIRKSGQEENKDKFCIKLTKKQEVRLFNEVFSKVDQSKFKTLKLPEALKVGSLVEDYWWWILTPFYEGEDKEFQWNEAIIEVEGGRKIAIELIDDVVNILDDLRSIPTTLAKDILKPFDLNQWNSNFIQRGEEFVKNGVIPVEFFEQAKTTFSTPQAITNSQSNLIISNGDFYFRNFKRLPNGKIMLFDWTENSGSWTTPSIEPIEHTIMYVWTLMWKNAEWQKQFLQKAMQRFNLTKENIQQGLMIKAFNQACAWGIGNHYLFKYQMEHFLLGLKGAL